MKDHAAQYAAWSFQRVKEVPHRKNSGEKMIIHNQNKGI